MKKTILATILATAAVFSHAQVSVTGRASIWMDNTKVSGSAATTMVTEPTSNIAISASEKLANGMTARAVIETSLENNTQNGFNTQLGDRQFTVGVSTATASVDLGRNVHSHFVAISKADPFQTLYGSIAGDVHNLRGLRFGDAVYIGLTPVKGMSLNYERTQENVVGPMWPMSGGAQGHQAEVIAAAGTVLGVAAGVAHYRQGTEQSTVITGSYQLGAAKVSVSHSDNQGAASHKGTMVGVSYKVAPAVTGKASYGRTNTDVTAWNLGLDHALSKRTDIGVAYRVVESAADVRQIGIGITHRF